MELWKQKIAELDIQDTTEEVSILGEDVTGVKSNNNGPDDLFYTEFSETDAKTFFDIFSKYKYSITTNKYALGSLEANLKEQVAKMSKGVNPIEVVLYASRCIKDQIYSNTKIIKILKGIIIPHLRFPDNSKICWHILAGWEWLAPICVLLESIGGSNNEELIKIAMDSYPHLAVMARETNERYLFTAYLNMLFETQNISLNQYIIDVVTNKNFVQDNELTDGFLKKINRIDYLNTDPVYSELLSAISAKSVTPAAFRIKIETALKGRKKTNGGGIIGDGPSPIDVESLQFGRSSRRDINMIKNLRESETIIIALRKVMDNIDNIFPEEQRGDAYVLLGTKGMLIRAEIISFLMEELQNNPNYRVPIYIALQELKEIGLDDVKNAISEVEYRQYWVNSLANYCRFRTKFLGDVLVPFFTAEIIENSADETIVKKYLTFLNDILNIYNAGAGKFNSDTILPEAIINMMKALNRTFNDRDIFDMMLSILALLAKACPSKKAKIKEQLYIIKENIKGNDSLKSIEMRVNSLIKSMESIVAPK